jgi:hypothetical protein
VQHFLFHTFRYYYIFISELFIKFKSYYIVSEMFPHYYYSTVDHFFSTYFLLKCAGKNKLQNAFFISKNIV